MAQIPVTVSVIIPTLNEAARVEALAASVCALPEAECIFADGGSTDGTQTRLQYLSEQYTNCRWVSAPRGRGIQMNVGANLAQGSWLLFLHADTDLPESSYLSLLSNITNRPKLYAHYPPNLPCSLAAKPLPTNCIAGAFTFRINHQRRIYRYLEWYVKQRCRFLKLPFGDQAIFVKRSTFNDLGGYKEDFPLMEDVDFVQRINKREGFQILEAPVYTSARRYEHEGYWKRATGNIALQLLYRLGVHPKRLASWYYK